jgi:5-methylcytosine-specific restriction endonuclease McrA
VQVVHVAEPDITSAASLALLAKHYCSLDKSIYTEYRMYKIRRRWMNLQMQTPDEEGGLTCAICGRKGLNPWAKDVNMRAVLDHIQEIALNGPWNDPANFQVTCDRCNNQKDAKRQTAKNANSRLTTQKSSV